jgi:hypothetical protein
LVISTPWPSSATASSGCAVAWTMVVKHAPVECPMLTEGARTGGTSVKQRAAAQLLLDPSRHFSVAGGRQSQTQRPRGDRGAQNEASVGQVLTEAVPGDWGTTHMPSRHRICWSTSPSRRRSVRGIRDRRPADDIIRGGPAVVTGPSFPPSIAAKIHSRGIRWPARAGSPE